MAKVAANKGRISVRTLVITVIKKATIPTSPLSQKKITAVLATSTLMIASTKSSDKIILQHISCIQYPVQFEENQADKVQALINFDNKINTITPAYVAKLGFTTQKTNVKA